jgi:hypothetical protein
MKTFIKLVVLGVLLCFLIWVLQDPSKPASLEEKLVNILNFDLDENSSNINIFFVETSGIKKEKAKNSAILTSRAACSIESAAMKNPDSMIFVVFVAKSDVENSKQINTLKTYSNVKFLRLDMEEFAEDTPMKKWIQSGKLNGKFIESNASNVLRLLLLWK